MIDWIRTAQLRPSFPILLLHAFSLSEFPFRAKDLISSLFLFLCSSSLSPSITHFLPLASFFLSFLTQLSKHLQINMYPNVISILLLSASVLLPAASEFVDLSIHPLHNMNLLHIITDDDTFLSTLVIFLPINQPPLLTTGLPSLEMPTLPVITTLPSTNVVKHLPPPPPLPRWHPPPRVQLPP